MAMSLEGRRLVAWLLSLKGLRHSRELVEAACAPEPFSVEIRTGPIGVNERLPGSVAPEGPLSKFTRGERCVNGHWQQIGWEVCRHCEMTPNFPSATRDRLTLDARRKE